MKKILVTLAAFIGLSVSAQTIGIASGPKTGTNYPMVENIVQMCSKDSMSLKNIESTGSLKNLFKIYEDKTTQLGVVQTDVLFYQQGVDKKMMDKIQMVFPFFTTEIHLIVKEDSNIKDLKDLVGKKVVEGPDGSGTWVTVQVIKSLTGIGWNGIQATQQEGYDGVKSGKYDAEFIVAGKPIKLLTEGSGVRLVSIKHPSLDKFSMYTRTPIDSDTYKFQKTPISTYKVDNVLATYAYEVQYQKEIADLVACISKNMDKLTKDEKFHPKWKSVDPLAINSINWPAHKSAKLAINREVKRTSSK